MLAWPVVSGCQAPPQELRWLSAADKEGALTTPLSFEALQGIFHRHSDPLPDHRQGPNTRYRLQAAIVGACGIFFTHSPSFLDSQRRRQPTKGHNNAHTLVGVEQMPGDHQVRHLLDPLAPSVLEPVFVAVVKGLEQHRTFASFRGRGAPWLVALDGTPYFASTAMQGQHGLSRQAANGPTRSYHAAITPVVVYPGHSQVIAVPPESILPQDGDANQDCERAAGNRGRATHAKQVAPQGVPFLGDALSSTQPFCALALQHGDNCIFVCTPDSPPKLDERWAFWQTTAGMAALASRHWHGRYPAVPQ